MKNAKTISGTAEASKRAPGRMVTFYSYKGGTGRSMALANVAWILASAGRRVLVIDWDLEAPGLHRYFRPFLPDPELVDTPGLIDFLAEFVEASRRQALAPRKDASEAETSAAWFEPYTDLLSCAYSLDYKFPEGATLDFVPAGRQGPSYPALVGTFQWRDFYERMGGGVFLEVVKKRLQATYDYVLIDSRTGLSDTSGICTVQMPDDLVVCFTLNRQSIFGAASAAASALQLRTKPDGGPGLRVWPVPTRIDQTEKEKLELARTMARENFTRHLWHLTREQRSAYWGRIEIFYVPFYAYLEVLAVAADRPRQAATVLSCMEQVTDWITGGEVKHFSPMKEKERLELLDRFTVGAKSTPPKRTGKPSIYLSYAKRDFPTPRSKVLFETLRRELPECRVFWDDEIPLGANWQETLPMELKNSDVIVFFVGHAALESRSVRDEMDHAIEQGKRIVPVLLDERISFTDLPKEIASSTGVFLGKSNRAAGVEKLTNGLRSLTLKIPARSSDPEDPQKGRWGGKSRADGRELTATVRTVSANWFSIHLRICPVNERAIEGIVEFHLHDSFDPDIARVEARRGEANLDLHAVGAFTVGALLEDGTMLELDLATLPEAPNVFRER